MLVLVYWSSATVHGTPPSRGAKYQKQLDSGFSTTNHFAPSGVLMFVAHSQTHHSARFHSFQLSTTSSEPGAPCIGSGSLPYTPTPGSYSVVVCPCFVRFYLALNDLSYNMRKRSPSTKSDRLYITLCGWTCHHLPVLHHRVRTSQLWSSNSGHAVFTCFEWCWSNWRDVDAAASKSAENFQRV